MSVLNALWALIAALVIAGFTAWFQYRSWRNQDWLKLKNKEQEAALSVISELSALMGKRLYRQKRYLWAVKAGSSDEKDSDTSEYRRILFEWNDKLSEMQTRIEYSFGRQAMMKLDQEVQDEFSDCHRLIELAKNGKEPLSSLDNVEWRLNVLGGKNISISSDLLRRVREEEFSIFPKSHYVSFGNRERLSCLYLIFRLFGLVSKKQ
nr:hypothetical protein [uncultured Halomonas sp.]